MIRRPLLPLCAIGLLLGLLNWVMQEPVPGDALLTRGLQALFGHQPGWANIITKSATEPWMWAMTLAVAILLHILHGARMALAAPISFALAIAADGLLRFYLHSPRPLAALVAVAKPSPSSGLPSTYGLVTGAIVALADRRGVVRAIGWIAIGWMVAGWAARVTMGGHWTSQLLASYALSAIMALGVIRLLRRG